SSDLDLQGWISFRLAIDMIQDLHTLFMRRHELGEARLHDLVPDQRVVLVSEAIGRADYFFEQFLELRIALLIRTAGAGQGQKDGERQQYRQGTTHGGTSAM